ncbi:hypothetical protein KA001_03490 [Patescibacteria group bacterium]|nr:hypothetical protein [Patescibacteria group bacterium]
MLEKLDAIIILKFGNPIIYKVKYGTTDYLIEKTGLHYSTQKGDTLYHIFGVVSCNTYFKIQLNTKTLNCYLVEQLEVS